MAGITHDPITFNNTCQAQSAAFPYLCMLSPFLVFSVFFAIAQLAVNARN